MKRGQHHAGIAHRLVRTVGPRARQPFRRGVSTDIRRSEPREYEQAVAEVDRQCTDNPDDFALHKNHGELYIEHRHGAPAAICDFTQMMEILEKQQV